MILTTTTFTITNENYGKKTKIIYTINPAYKYFPYI